MTSKFNYVATALKPTAVNHSCVGKFTGPEDRNLIIAKFTRLEVYLLEHEDCFKKILDVPVYGSIDSMQLFCPDNEKQDLLFMTTRQHKFCVLQWDSDDRQVITRSTGDFSDFVDKLPPSEKICTVNEDCSFIALHVSDGLLSFIPGLVNKTGDVRPLSFRLEEEAELLDMKFLYSCGGGTLIVLYEDKDDTRHLQTHTVAAVDNAPALALLSKNSLDYDAFILIPVPPPLNGVLVVGTSRIDYFSVFGNESNLSCNSLVSSLKETSLRPVYEMVDGNAFMYLLGDESGHLHLLSIAHEKERVTGLELKLLGVTSVASTISYLGNQLVYIGSMNGDSMLIRWNHEADIEGSYLTVLERYLNVGGINDIYMIDSERNDQGQIVSFSKGFQDGSFRNVRKGTEIKEVGSVELPGIITGMWSLKSGTNERYYKYLVVSFIDHTRMWKMNPSDGKLEVHTEVDGFRYDVNTLFAHDVLDSEIIQITPKSARVMNLQSGFLSDEWLTPANISITVATANNNRVLLATNTPGELVYLEIAGGVFEERKRISLEVDICCLDISSMDENSNFSNFAAVGLWDMKVSILSLPDLAVIGHTPIGGGVLRSVLFCIFEEVLYLLCGGFGYLFTYQLNTDGSLTGVNELLLGDREVEQVCVFSVKNTTHVFAASDRPVVIFSSDSKLLYSDVYLKTVSYVCPFSIPSSPDSLAIVVNDKLTVYSVGDVHKFYVHSTFLKEPSLHICYEKKSRTVATYGSNSSEFFVRLLDQEFNILSTISLDQGERIKAILNCSLSDNKSYYCIGTGYEKQMRGRILVLNAEDQMLRVVAEIHLPAPVLNLNATVDGKLISSFAGFISLYSLVVNDDGIRQVRIEFEELMPEGAFVDYIETRGNTVAAVGRKRFIVQFLYTPVENTLQIQADHNRDNDMSALVILNDDLYLGADEVGNIFTLFKKTEVTDEQEESVEVVGEYHLGLWVNCFRHGSLASDSAVPTIIFRTFEGSIGVIASLSEEKYNILEKLQNYLRGLNRGLGGLSHRDYRVYAGEKKFDDSRNFVDGDLIESFNDLDNNRMNEISEILDLSVEGIKELVQELKCLH